MKTTHDHYSPELYRQFDTDEAAEILDIAPRSLEKKRQEGTGPPFVRLSPKCVRYRLIDLIKYQEAHLKTNTLYAPKEGDATSSITTGHSSETSTRVVSNGQVRKGAGR